jgi:hypothetical protein
MNATLQHPSLGRPARLLICAAFAAAITLFTTQAVIRSAGQPEYGVAATRQPWSAPLATQRATPGSAPAAGSAMARQISVARAH